MRGFDLAEHYFLIIAIVAIQTRAGTLDRFQRLDLVVRMK